MYKLILSFSILAAIYVGTVVTQKVKKIVKKDVEELTIIAKK